MYLSASSACCLIQTQQDCKEGNPQASFAVSQSVPRGTVAAFVTIVPLLDNNRTIVRVCAWSRKKMKRVRRRRRNRMRRRRKDKCRNRM
jgi:hypothetical protein